MQLRGLEAAALLPLLLPLLLAAPAAAQDRAEAPPRWEGPDVRGRVVDLLTGSPLAGAEVSLAYGNQRAFTDEGGRFYLPDLSIGENVLMVTHLGYENLVRVLEVEEEAVRIDGDIVLEVVMEPRPIELEGLEIMADKFANRVRAAPVTTRVVDREQILRSAATNALDLLRQRAGINVGRCPPSLLFSDTCILSFGRRIPADLWIDEIKVVWGLDELEYYPVDDIYRMEVYDRRHIRVYTVAWMRDAAVERPVFPYLHFPDHHRPRWRSGRGPGWQ